MKLECLVLLFSEVHSFPTNKNLLANHTFNKMTRKLKKLLSNILI